MRWLKIFLVIIIVLGGVYAALMSVVDESQDFTIEKELPYPVDKVFPQFVNLQNFARWNTFFSKEKNLSFQFFAPYEGQGSSMTYRSAKGDKKGGELFVRYVNPNRTLKLELFEGEDNMPYHIDIKFIPSGNKTKVIWYIHTPAQPYLRRSVNLIEEDDWAGSVDKSMAQLSQMMGNKVQRENRRNAVVFDSIFVDRQESALLLGISANVKNNKGAFFQSIVQHHNKVTNYAKLDLGKEEDEFGEPQLLADGDQFKDKIISFYYGIPMLRREKIFDNNFTYRETQAGTAYVIYYKGNFAGRLRAVQQLREKAKFENLIPGKIIITFLEEPVSEDKVLLKISMPVS